MAVDGLTFASQISTVFGFSTLTCTLRRVALMCISSASCLSVKFPLVTESLFDRGRSWVVNSRRNPENAQLLLGMRRKPELRFRNQAIRLQELRSNVHPARPSTRTGEDAPEPGVSGRGEETPPERLSQMVAQLRQEDKVDNFFPN